jgi:putative ABC transport system permease protein
VIPEGKWASARGPRAAGGAGGRLVARSSRRHLFRHPWQLLLTVLGVSLGVAITVSIDLAIQSSREAFRVSSETITGRATHQILGGPAGLPDALPAQLRIEAGVRALAPVVEGWGVHPDDPTRPLRILGVDPFQEGPFRPFLGGGPSGGLDGGLLVATVGAAFVAEATALRLDLAEGDAMPLRLLGGDGELLVAGLLQVEDRFTRQGMGDLVVVDVAEAQDLLGRVGFLDRIDLILPEGPAGDDRLAALAPYLPADAQIVPAGAREQTMEQMVRAFDLNLTALSLLGLVFGVFLIYNTMTFSVVQRRRLFGTLRALGVTRGQLLRRVLAEALALGGLGAVLGTALGVLLGRGLVRLITRTINDLYFVVSVEGLSLPPGVLLKGAALGVVATLLASLPPAWEATTVSPREALARSTVESRVRAFLPRMAVGGGLLLTGGLALLLLTSRSLGAAFAGLFAVLVGMALLVPGTSVVVLGLVRPILVRLGGVLGGMAARGVVTSMSRTAPALASLVIAVSVVVGLGVMIQSFRGSVVRWLDVTLQADLYVSPPGVVSNRLEGRLPLELVDVARALPGVDGVSTYLSYEQMTPDYGMARFVALGLDPRGERSLDLLAGEGRSSESARDVLFRRFRAGEGVLISEPFAFRHRLGPGDPVVLPVGKTLPVLGVFRDYGSEMGTVMVAASVWGEEALTSFALFLAPGVRQDEARREALEAALRMASDVPMTIRSNEALRTLTLEVFDRTFEVTRVLRLLAFVVAFIAVLSALMALELERAREIGVLRASGMTPGQTWGLVSAQTGLMGLLAGILALPVGWLLAAVMIHVVNRRSFGWTLEMDIGLALPVQAVALALAGAMLAGLYPAWRMSRTSPAEALRSE